MELPAASREDSGLGWHLSVEFLKDVQKEASYEIGHVSLETIEEVLLQSKKILEPFSDDNV